MCMEKTFEVKREIWIVRIKVLLEQSKDARVVNREGPWKIKPTEDQEYPALPPYWPLDNSQLLMQRVRCSAPSSTESAEGPILGHFLINEGCPQPRISFVAPSLAPRGIGVDNTRFYNSFYKHTYRHKCTRVHLLQLQTILYRSVPV